MRPIDLKAVRYFLIHPKGRGVFGQVIKTAWIECLGTRCTAGTHGRLGKCNEHCVCISETWKCCRVRKDITEMSQDELDILVSAFYKMRKSKEATAKFQYLSDKHVEYQNTIHAWPYFLPWHRMWIFLFEEILRSFDCRVTVPYFDLTKHWKDWYAHPPFDAKHLGGNGHGRNCCVDNGPFREGLWKTLPNFGGGCLQCTFNKSKIMPSPRIATLAIGLFGAEQEKLMSSMISKYFHDFLHMAVGGQILMATAAVDPTFWMLHGFLDKMWAVWQDRGPSFKNQFLAKMNKVKLLGSPPGTDYTPVDFYDLWKQPGGVRVCYSAQVSDEEAEFRDLFVGLSVPRRKGLRNFSESHLLDIISSLKEDEIEQFSMMLRLAYGELEHKFIAMPGDCVWENKGGSLRAKPGLPKIYQTASDSKAWD